MFNSNYFNPFKKMDGNDEEDLDDDFDYMENIK